MTAADFISRAERQRASADEAEGRIARERDALRAACRALIDWDEHRLAFGDPECVVCGSETHSEDCPVGMSRAALASSLVPLVSPSGTVVAYATPAEVREYGLGSIAGEVRS